MSTHSPSSALEIPSSGISPDSSRYYLFQPSMGQPNHKIRSRTQICNADHFDRHPNCEASQCKRSLVVYHFGHLSMFWILLPKSKGMHTTCSSSGRKCIRQCRRWWRLVVRSRHKLVNMIENRASWNRVKRGLPWKTVHNGEFVYKVVEGENGAKATYDSMAWTISMNWCLAFCSLFFKSKQQFSLSIYCRFWGEIHLLFFCLQ